MDNSSHRPPFQPFSTHREGNAPSSFLYENQKQSAMRALVTRQRVRDKPAKGYSETPNIEAVIAVREDGA